ncbi:MAG: minor capsid protein [Cyanobacteria bacterium P01_C01_bin.120]
MLVDSVFSPILQFAEQPLIPAAQIERAQRRIENRYSNEMIEALEAETQRYLNRMDDALADQDVRAINASQWPTASILQRIIFELWTDAFALGGEQGIEEMRAATSDAKEFSRVCRFAVPLDVQRDIEAIFELETPQLINTDAVEAVVGRANLLAGDFADDVFLDLRKHLVAAIVPQADTGNPISQSELLERIQKTLKVSEARAKVIARTEITAAYNQGRQQSFNESDLVDYIRFIAISDDRTTDICISRDGMLMPKSDVALVTANTPPLHYACRSTISPVMSRLSRFEEIVTDPQRDPQNRTLAPLLKGWAS